MVSGFPADILFFFCLRAIPRRTHGMSSHIATAAAPRPRDRVAAAGRFAPFVLLQSASQDGARLLTHLLDAHPDVRAAGGYRSIEAFDYVQLSVSFFGLGQRLLECSE